MNFLKKSQSFHKILKQGDLCSAILPHLKMVFAIASSQVMLIFLCHNSQVKMSWQSFWQFVMEIEASENIKCKIHYWKLCKICWFTWSWGFKIWNNKMNTDFTAFHTFSCWMTVVSCVLVAWPPCDHFSVIIQKIQRSIQKFMKKCQIKAKNVNKKWRE